LTFNDSARFEDRWVYLKRPAFSSQSSAEDVWGQGLPEIIMLPVAHGEGKFYTNTECLRTIEESGQVAFRYVDARGQRAAYPYNPNGSLNSIAGITDNSGRVLGLMPHPERFMFKHHFPFWRREEMQPWGLKIFQNAVNYYK